MVLTKTVLVLKNLQGLGLVGDGLNYITDYNLVFLVTEVPGLNLVGRDAIKALEISEDDFLFSRALAIAESSKVDGDLQTARSKLCDKNADLFKLEVGCLRDVELEIKFKSEATPIFMSHALFLLPFNKILPERTKLEILEAFGHLRHLTIGEHALSLFESHHFQVIINRA